MELIQCDAVCVCMKMLYLSLALSMSLLGSVCPRASVTLFASDDFRYGGVIVRRSLALYADESHTHTQTPINYIHI